MSQNHRRSLPDMAIPLWSVPPPASTRPLQRPALPTSKDMGMKPPLWRSPGNC